MKVRIEFQNDEVTTESAVNAAEITSPQVTTAEDVAEVVNRMIESTVYRSPAVMAALIENHLRVEDAREFIGLLGPDTLEMLASHMQVAG